MNNSATTRRISKIAVEYNGNDKGTAKCVYTNNLLGESPELQFEEMKFIAERNKNVQKWALTGYISPIKETGDKLTDEELKEIALKALKMIGVTDSNQIRLDIHNSSKHKHIHFIVNRITTNGKCNIKARNIGKRFGEAVRQVVKEKGLKTDVEIGIEKKGEMFKNLKESIALTKSFEELMSEMKKRGFIVSLNENVKDGISGMRIVMEKDINRQTERVYAPGYKLSEITRKLKIKEIKAVYEVKAAFNKCLKESKNFGQLKNQLHKEGFRMKIEYNEFGKPEKGIKNIFIKKIDDEKPETQNGVFFHRYKGFSLFEIAPELNEKELKGIFMSNNSSEPFENEYESNNETAKKIERFLDEILTPNYVANQEDEFRKKKKKRNKR